MREPIPEELGRAVAEGFKRAGWCPGVPGRPEAWTPFSMHGGMPGINTLMLNSLHAQGLRYRVKKLQYNVLTLAAGTFRITIFINDCHNEVKLVMVAVSGVSVQLDHFATTVQSSNIPGNTRISVWRRTAEVVNNQLYEWMK